MFLLKEKKNITKGFTLVEVMVSVAIFSIIMTVGMGALVDLTKSYKDAQAKKALVTKLNFALEGMSREIRLGRNYNNTLSFNGAYYEPEPDVPGESSGVTQHIGFNATAGKGYYTYFLHNGALKRSIFDFNTGTIQVEDLVDVGEISVEDFSVIVDGAYPKFSAGGPTDEIQARVLLKISATSLQGDALSVDLQTRVTQRIIDQ